ncbi:MAG: zinc-dependent peptidase [Lentisphaeraceae bacterium]|nr:zinc-dependent peptidase [Lentisphaeraceae bacterium]
MIEIFGMIALFAILIFGIDWLSKLGERRRQKWQEEGLSSEDLKILESHLKVYTRLPETLQKKLSGLVNSFINEKAFTGCQELEVTREMKVVIAGQACLLLLNNKTQPWYKKLHTVLIYPSAYKVKTRVVNDQGFYENLDSVRLGESWGGGTIVLSWNHSRHGAVNYEDGHNVVIHEFAHQLDQSDGAGDGTPTLESQSCYASWASLLGREYKKLVRKTMKQQKSVMDKYGATNEAEFFAVATECFFEKPRQMNKRHKELFEALKKYYGVNPLEWL